MIRRYYIIRDEHLDNIRRYIFVTNIQIKYGIYYQHLHPGVFRDGISKRGVQNRNRL